MSPNSRLRFLVLPGSYGYRALGVMQRQFLLMHGSIINGFCVPIELKGKRPEVMEARKAIETFLERKVFLEMHVKVKEGWRDDDRLLKGFGYKG